MFSNSDLKKLIVPLFIEQLLVMMVGIADTFVVSYAGEAAVSGVSLVNAFNTIFIYLFTALASGGAVVISQYIGRKSMENAGESASQLLMVSTLFSVLCMAVILIAYKQILKGMFGKVEPEVMEACVVYLKISAYSYPALAIYNAGAALYRSVGKTKTTMYISLISNLVNVIGNIIGVFILKAGVAGVAYPSLIARLFSAIVITVLCFKSSPLIQYQWKWIVGWNQKLLCSILNIAVPNGVENGIFQLVKVALSSVVALFGTYQIAANGIAQSIWSMAALVSVTMGPVFLTVIGQCMGAGDITAARSYFNKLLKLTILLSLVWNVLIFMVTPLIMKAYILEDETKHLVILLVLVHNLFSATVFPLAGPLGNGLRAAGDVKFTMVVSIASTIGGRFVFSILFGIVMKLGVMGIAYAMCLDWVIRAVIFYFRLKSEAWEKFNVI